MEFKLGVFVVKVLLAPADAVFHGLVTVGPFLLPVVPVEVGAAETAVVVKYLGAFLAGLVLVVDLREELLHKGIGCLYKVSVLYLRGCIGIKVCVVFIGIGILSALLFASIGVLLLFLVLVIFLLGSSLRSAECHHGDNE